MVSCIFEDGNKANLRHVVVDAIIIKDKSILMVKRAAKLLEGGKWGLVGGYLDKDETLVEGLKREVMEETGYELKTVNFFTILDAWDRKGEDRQNIAMIYICSPGKKKGEHDWESTEVKWFDLDNLPLEEEIAFDHLKTINLYLNNRNFNPINLLKY